jgi:hypothetical protein
VALFENVMKVWFSAESRQVLDLYRNFSPEGGLSKPEWTKIILLRFARHDAEATLAYAKGLTEEEGRTAIVAELSTTTASGALAAADRALRLRAGDDRREALEKALSAWANSDFRSAAAWGERSLAGEERKSVLWGLLEEGGGRQDPAAAGELCLRIFEGKELYNMGVERVVRFWSDADPAAVAAFLLRLPAVEGKENPREHMSAEVGRKWALRDPAAAVAWAEQFPKAEERTAALSAIGEALVKSVHADPTEALALVHKLPERDRKSAMAVIVSAWAELDYRAAASVAQSFSGGPVGTGAIARSWAARDVDGALAWSRTLPEGEAREEALSGLAFHVMDRDLGKAAGIAREITSPAARKIALDMVMGSWAAADAKAAAEWIQRAELPEAEKTLLRKTLDAQRK